MEEEKNREKEDKKAGWKRTRQAEPAGHFLAKTGFFLSRWEMKEVRAQNKKNDHMRWTSDMITKTGSGGKVS